MSDSWRGKKVFLTGHTGFKGAWLSIWLDSLGAKVTGYALKPPTKPSLFELCRLDRRVRSNIGDVRDAARLKKALLAARPEIVIHMAAQPLVRESYRAPAETYGTNVMGTVNLLEAVRACSSVKAVVNVTTDKCYENKEHARAFREDEPMGGYDPYSSSKACSELVTSAYRNSFFNPAEFKKHGVALASARAGNVIGGGDWAADRLIPDLIRAALRGEKVRIRSPRAVRPWQHVLEPLSGYLLLAERLYKYGPKYEQAWNFGPDAGDAKDVEWIVKRMFSRWPEVPGYAIDKGRHPHEAHYLKLDSSKARRELGWAPRWNVGMAVDRTVEWFKAWRRGGDIRAVCLKQIVEYAAKP
ncbi:MAG: CDP-glucose 4,6-dehydratase [Elusimicrobia bacterium CG08_land_8_20_14_0_20_59_10]|nr:MAG: CDP-glucose 4,6-dehydratase [Elusimicrobia bacterium CG08_land_8_20_14_0_20_59_10]